MERFYLVFSDNAQRGPYSVPQLETMVRNGELGANAVVWTEGMTDWQPIATVVTTGRIAPSAPTPMSPVRAAPAPQSSSVKESDQTFVLVAHILMIASVFTVGAAAIAAVVMAYIKLPEVRGTYLESHCQQIIGTFWWSLLLGVVGVVLTFLIIGFPILLGAFVWFVYRCVMGLVRISERRAV
jgi:uncharacterized membrane protein